VGIEAMTMEQSITFPEDAPAPDPVARVPQSRASRAVNLASFAEMASPGRRVTRDIYFDSAFSPTRSLEPDTGAFSLATWVMIVVAGVVLGVAMTLMAAGS
jgi:hypothetical protein